MHGVDKVGVGAHMYQQGINCNEPAPFLLHSIGVKVAGLLSRAKKRGKVKGDLGYGARRGGAHHTGARMFHVVTVISSTSLAAIFEPPKGAYFFPLRGSFQAWYYGNAFMTQLKVERRDSDPARPPKRLQPWLLALRGRGGQRT